MSNSKLFAQTLSMMDAAASIYMQRIPMKALMRYFKTNPAHKSKPNQEPEISFQPTQEEINKDPVIEALSKLNTTTFFKECQQKGLDMGSSFDFLANVHKAEPTGKAAILLAWKIQYDATRKTYKKPELVGMATLSRFKETSAFSTSNKDISPDNLTKLRPFMNSSYIYIDAMCSKRKEGVGLLMVLHAYKYAQLTKSGGLIALSYKKTKPDYRSNQSGKPKNPPDSFHIFSELKFEPEILQASFKHQGMHGRWFSKKADNESAGALWKQMAKANGMNWGMGVCARPLVKPRSDDPNRRVWRCPQ